jgi:hypothetical protein
MPGRAPHLQRRVESLRMRIESLFTLRRLVALPPARDITARQWTVIESELRVVGARLLGRLKRAARAYLPRFHDRAAIRGLNALLGEIELEMSSAFGFFDTYMDVLTQRQAPGLSRLLAGCDVLARDSIDKDHPALAIVEPPIVYCDRGFGASTLREGVLLPGRGRNPLPLVQIPYSRLNEKCNLTSIYHEMGHDGTVRLGLVSALPKALRKSLAAAGASSTLQDLFALWCSEIGPDLWAFCACGIAATGTVREILALPPRHAFRVHWTDPHPPPYLRVLLSFQWCRELWGTGIWDRWEREWRDAYRLEDAPEETREIVRAAARYLPLVGKALLQTRFPELNGKTIPALFDLRPLAPSALARIAGSCESGVLSLKGLAPSTQLAVFRWIKERGTLDEEAIDRLMTQWLLQLAERRRHLH